jgi:hypothetical protein
MDESKADEIAQVWVKRIAARPYEWTPDIATALSELPDPRAWATADDGRLAVLAGDRLYVLAGRVEHGADHLRAIDLQVLGDLSKLGLSSARTFLRDEKPGYDTHSWTLRDDVLDEPLTFQFGRTDEEEVDALWAALAGLG